MADFLVIGRLVGVDHGGRRIGLAISDVERRIAFPADVIEAGRSAAESAARVAKWGAEHDATGFVVGLPLNMDGTAGAQAKLSQQFADALRAASKLPVTMWDERLSSFQADELAGEVDPRGRRGTAKRDALAAMVILRAYLNASETPAGTDRG